MNKVGLPLTTNGGLCKRLALIEQLKAIAKDVESCGEKSPPLCTKSEKEKENQPDDTRCYCSSVPGYHYHFTVDGRVAKPWVREADNAYKPFGKRWCPPCMHITPKMDRMHNCYRGGMVKGKVSARNGLPTESAGSYQRTPPLEIGKKGCCSAAQVGVPSSQNTLQQQMVTGSAPQRQVDNMDDPLGGQNCPHVHPPPTMKEYHCPEGDPCHYHWSPTPSTQCRYPNTCVASCFHHPVLSDWIYDYPKYMYYLQNVNYKPFRKGV